MRAQDEAALQEQLFGRALDGAPALGVLVLQPEAQELRRLELHVRRQRPLPAALDGQLGPVAAQAGGPATIDVVLGVRVRAPALDLPVASGVGVHAAEATQPLGGQREDRESGTGADPLAADRPGGRCSACRTGAASARIAPWCRAAGSAAWRWPRRGGRAARATTRRPGSAPPRR